MKAAKAQSHKAVSQLDATSDQAAACHMRSSGPKVKALSRFGDRIGTLESDRLPDHNVPNDGAFGLRSVVHKIPGEVDVNGPRQACGATPNLTSGKWGSKGMDPVCLGFGDYPLL